MLRPLPCLTLAALGGVAACGASESQLRTRAAFDLSCPEDKLRIVEIDDRTRGVVGCGQRVTYVDTCAATQTNLGGCTWILNTDGKPNRKASPSSGAE